VAHALNDRASYILRARRGGDEQARISNVRSCRPRKQRSAKPLWQRARCAEPSTQAGTHFALPPRMSNSPEAKPRTAPPSTPHDIETRILEILRERDDLNDVQLTRETTFHELGDSLTQVEIVMEIEDEFELSIPDNVAERLTNVGQMMDYLADAVRNRPAEKDDAATSQG
jgi:acyl carrier protein